MQDVLATTLSDDGSGDDTVLLGYFQRQAKLGELRGRPFTSPPNYKRYMEEVGFADVHVEIKYWPIGDWMEEPRMKEIGKWMRLNMIEGMRSIARVSTAEGRTKEDDEAEIAAVAKEIQDPDIHLYMPL